MPEFGFFYFYVAAFILLLPPAVVLFRWWRRPSFLRLAAGNLVVLFFLLFAVLLIGEAYFYFFYDTTDGAMILLTSRRWAKRHMRLNDLGFRGKKPPKAEDPRKPGEIRIAVVGDSFVFGQGIKREEDLFPEVLEKTLRESGIPASVYGIAKQGWGTDVQLSALGVLAMKGYRFDVVILAYVLNDHFTNSDLPEDYREALRRATTHSRTVTWILSSSLFINFLYHRLTTFRDPMLQKYDRITLDIYNRPEVLARQSELLREFKQLCDQEGMRLRVVTFPMILRPWDKYILGGIHRDLDEFWGQLGVPDLDLLDELKKFKVEELVVGPLDTHPNELANLVAAEATAEAYFGVKR